MITYWHCVDINKSLLRATRLIFHNQCNHHAHSTVAFCKFYEKKEKEEKVWGFLSCCEKFNKKFVGTKFLTLSCQKSLFKKKCAQTQKSLLRHCSGFCRMILDI